MREVAQLALQTSHGSLATLLLRPWAIGLMRERLDTGEPSPGAPAAVYDGIVEDLWLGEQQEAACLILRRWWERSSARLQAARAALAREALAAPGDVALQAEVADGLEALQRLYPTEAAAAILVVHTSLLTSAQLTAVHLASFPWQPHLTGFLDAIERRRAARDGGGAGR
ncbi:MAG: hypothetical protein J3K34DRAFT_426450 [Monoraphidium minutum]|nr:MAG: hypothetical protein J3K34DRAFT_426450 [Monoraphidium minutum]